jgi:hypothetical protein
MNTTLGLFQVAYEGSAMSAANEIGIGYTSPIEDTYLYGSGNWVNVSQDPTAGAVSIGNPYARRTPWYTQTDANLMHTFKVNKNNEAQTLSFSATVTNLLNQRAPVSYWETFASYWNPSGSFPNNQIMFGGAAYYQAAETGYNVPQSIASQPGFLGSNYIGNSEYGKPNIWQRSRSLRLGVKFTF